MHAAFASLVPTFAPTYDLFGVALLSPTLEGPPPTGTFVDKLVAALASTFVLDEREQELALLLLFGRSIGAAGRRMGLDNREVQRRCRALFSRTGTDGRQQLFELAVRLAAMAELSKHFLARRSTSDQPSVRR